MNRIKSLDGIRAISIFMVLLGHCADTIGPVITDNNIFPFFANARLGVRIFFVISGYLITTILIKERNKPGPIILAHFYIKRTLRIFPVFYLYIIVLILLKNFFIPTLFDNYEWIAFASVFGWNYAHLFIAPNAANENVVWFFGHFWTLSMEEQFYLLWPITFIKISVFWLKRLILGIIILAPLIRLATYYFMPDSRGQIEMMLHTGGSVILVGCLGALLENSSFFKKRILNVINSNALIIFLALFLFVISPILSFSFQGVYKLPFGAGLESMAIILLLFWCINVPSKVSNFLNGRLISHIGVLSYSLYIWQQLFLNNKIHYWFNQFPQNIVLVFVVAHLSYYFIEMPFLGLKKRFIKPDVSLKNKIPAIVL